ncbi:hypothetical protein VN24_10330 [Paenibacillus beijingensis]|uniref:Uncharacterized protein n=1 Tax=Paenibacillus beijingensis TaxID=1126833 RepID=A0A0D5NJ10_9BACL|nr:hypothetical protein VN24_10330 [Paenibacillus beijingensis]
MQVIALLVATLAIHPKEFTDTALAFRISMYDANNQVRTIVWFPRSPCREIKRNWKSNTIFKALK